MNFAPEDFNDMVFNPTTIGNKKMTEAYPILARFIKAADGKELDQCGGSDKFLKHLAYMFDIGTPLKKITNYRSRKKEAMHLAKYKWMEKQNSWSPEAKFVMEEASATLNRLTVLFVRQFRSHDYEYYVAMDRAYHRAIENTMVGSGSREKDMLLAVDEYKKRVKEAEHLLFMAKPTEVISQETMMVAEEEQLNISPEDIAERLKHGIYIRPYH